MENVTVVEGQSQTFDVLAKILHTRREKVIDLIGRKTHPLPLPFRRTSGSRFELNNNYRRQLHKWVAEEKQMQAITDENYLNLDRLEQELTGQAEFDRSREKWSVEQDLDHFPPGNFLG
jgi:hypothetical protein